MSNEEIEKLLNDFSRAAISLHTMWGLSDADEMKIRAINHFQKAKAALVVALS